MRNVPKVSLASGVRRSWVGTGGESSIGFLRDVSRKRATDVRRLPYGIAGSAKRPERSFRDFAGFDECAGVLSSRVGDRYASDRTVNRALRSPVGFGVAPEWSYVSAEPNAIAGGRVTNEEAISRA